MNNAAVFVDKDATSGLETTDDHLLDTYRANVAGPMLVTQALLPNLERSRRKLVVHISSDFASITKAGKDNWSGYLAYRSSKAALSMVHVLLANELRPRGVTCLAVHPGWVQTDMGGPDAQITTEQSVSAMLKVIDRATLADTAKFFSYTGDELPW
ncbi:MAG: SDR family NAD(P)-dependent oxidoreductase [Phycisphaerales bacterium]